MSNNQILIDNINESMISFNNEMIDEPSTICDFKNTLPKLKLLYLSTKTFIEKRKQCREKKYNPDSSNEYKPLIEQDQNIDYSVNSSQMGNDSNFYHINKPIYNNIPNNNQNNIYSNIIHPNIINNSAINNNFNNHTNTNNTNSFNRNNINNTNNNTNPNTYGPSNTNHTNHTNNTNNTSKLPNLSYNNLKLFYNNNEISIASVPTYLMPRDIKQFNFTHFIKKLRIKNFLKDNTHLMCDEIINLNITFVDTNNFQTTKFYEHLKTHQNDYYALAFKKHYEKGELDPFYLLSFQKSPKSNFGEFVIMEITGAGEGLNILVQELENDGNGNGTSMNSGMNANMNMNMNANMNSNSNMNGNYSSEVYNEQYV